MQQCFVIPLNHGILILNSFQVYIILWDISKEYVEYIRISKQTKFKEHSYRICFGNIHTEFVLGISIQNMFWEYPNRISFGMSIQIKFWEHSYRIFFWDSMLSDINTVYVLGHPYRICFKTLIQNMFWEHPCSIYFGT